MTGHGVPPPTFVVKVNLNCCESCPKKAKKQLQKIEGVNSINIDAEKGYVVVSGFVESSVLEKAMTKLDRKAEVLVYEKNPMQAEEKLDQLYGKMNKGQALRKYHDEHDDHDSLPAQQKVLNPNFVKGNWNFPPYSDQPSLRPHPDYVMGTNVGGFGWNGQRVVHDPTVYDGGYRHGLPPPPQLPVYGIPSPPSFSLPSDQYLGYLHSDYGRPLLRPEPSAPPLPPEPAAPAPPRRMSLTNVEAAHGSQKEAPVCNSSYSASECSIV